MPRIHAKRFSRIFMYLFYINKPGIFIVKSHRTTSLIYITLILIPVFFKYLGIIVITLLSIYS